MYKTANSAEAVTSRLLSCGWNSAAHIRLVVGRKLSVFLLLNLPALGSGKQHLVESVKVSSPAFLHLKPSLQLQCCCYLPVCSDANTTRTLFVLRHADTHSECVSLCPSHVLCPNLEG